MKKFIIIGVVLLVLFLGLLGYVIWFRVYHTCVEWEETPTQTYCAAYMPVSIGKTTIMQCISYQVCKGCTKWITDDRVREKPKVPAGACP
jgi:hypothetical protein